MTYADLYSGKVTVKGEEIPTSPLSSLPRAREIAKTLKSWVADGRFELGEAQMPMPTPAAEINLIETFAETRVIGMTINHENMSDAEVSSAILQYENELGIPTTDALSRPTDRLAEMVLLAFPKLARKAPFAA